MTTIDSLLRDGRIVKSVKVVVHTTGAIGPNTPMSNNHWSIYLLLANNKGSLRLNMRAEWDDTTEAWNTTGILECSTHAYTLTHSAIGSWDYTVPDVTVGWICTLLWNEERDTYDMSGGGSGCRWWVYCIIQLLENQRYISSGSAEDLYPKLLFLYSTSGETRDLPMVKGEFYSTGRFSGSTIQQSIQSSYSTVTATSSYGGASSANPAMASSSGGVGTATVAAVSPQDELPKQYFYVYEGTYYYCDGGNVTKVDPPKNQWVLNQNGWKDTGRTKKWRFWDGRVISYV
ncbi:hypothetical protein BJ875DRAFT_498264 [Amylocarpus encephaloides]|uniref:DUF7770 domain-containing protein n=1 Tax=Amylocarpus encephaloides TaxID=45428 RepID=A0A9P7YD30_9HELO|nr:hypothetical protein BJ875DRAFT_498264 [Amylocarpus encephaloides]